MKKLLVGCFFLFIVNFAFATETEEVCSYPTIKVGLIAELTGSMRDIGKAEKNAALLAVQNINNSGGIKIGGLDYKIDLIIADTASKPEQAASVAKTLITQNKVVAIIGPSSSNNFAPVAEVVEKYNVPTITPWATDNSISFDPKTKQPRHYVFRVCFTDLDEVESVGKFAVHTLKAKTAAVFFDSGFQVFKEQSDFFQKVFTQLGGKIVFAESYNAKTKSFASLLTELKNAAPDVVFMPSYFASVAPILTLARQIGVTAPFIGSDGWFSGDLFKYCGMPCNGSYVINHFLPTVGRSQDTEFIKAYALQYGFAPNDVAALTYDAFGLLAEALKNAKHNDRQAIQESLAKISSFRGITGEMHFRSGSGDPIKKAVIMKINEGKLIGNE